MEARRDLRRPARADDARHTHGAADDVACPADRLAHPIEGDIAATLVVSHATVKTHLDHILGTLVLRSRAQAVVVAYEPALVRPGGTG